MVFFMGCEKTVDMERPVGLFYCFTSMASFRIQEDKTKSFCSGVVVFTSMASFRIPQQHLSQFYTNSSLNQYNPRLSVTENASFPGFAPPISSLGVLKLSNLDQSSTDSTPISDVPVLTCEEAIERLRLCRMRHRGKQQFLAMYSSVYGGITTDPAAMVIPMDDHMVHRGHGVFDTAAIVDGYLYELDQHLDRCERSASMAKISLPFDKETMRSILVQTVSVSKCRNGSLRYWLSAGYGDFVLSPSGCAGPAFYAVVIQSSAASSDHKGTKIITSSIPIKPPEFASVKSVNYLPNALCQMEAEDNGCFTSIWLDSEGFIAEGPNMNVAFVNREKVLLIPKFDKTLSGCTAKRVLAFSEELRKEGHIREVCVRDVTMEEGKRSEEMMLLGSGVLVRPIVQWDDQVIGNGTEGPIARALLNLLLEDMKSGPSAIRVRVPY